VTLPARRLLPLLAVCLVLSCDRESPVGNDASSANFALSPRILAPAGVVLPTVDSVRIEALDAENPSASPYYDRTVGWDSHTDTIRQIFRETDIVVSISGLKTQSDGSHAVWWHGTATDTFLGTRRFAAQSLPVPVFVGDTVAPLVLSRGSDTIQNTDTTLRLVWNLREDSSFTAVVDGDTVGHVGDSVVWTRTWTSGSALAVRASFRDNTGNLSLDSLVAIRRDRVGVPFISVPSGSYDDIVHVALSDSTPGALIRYSLDSGRTWRSYDTTLLLGADVALQAIATKAGLTASAISQAAYSIAAAAPTFSVPSGTASDDLLTLKLSSTTPGSGFQYSPDSGRTWVAYSDSLVLGTAVQLLARATKAGLTTSPASRATYAIRAAAPVFSLPTGTASNDLLTLTLSSATPGGGFQYSLDTGKTWSAYSDSVAIGTSVQVLARTIKAGLATSPTSQATYAVQAAPPSFSFPTGTSSSDLMTVVLASTTFGASFQYSLDTGKTWSAYVDSIALGSSVQILARTVKAGLATSSASSATYAIAVATPTFSLASGTSSNDLLALMLNCTTPGARIQYSTDSSNWQPYADSLVVGSTTTVYARALKTGVATSAVAKAAFTVQASAPVFSPIGGTYDTTQSVTIASATPGSVVHCTTDGSTPTTASPTCASIQVGMTETVQAVATKAGLAGSVVSAAAYAFDTLPTPTFGLAPGAYTGLQRVTLSTASTGATIHYTTDGSIPTRTSPTYAGPISPSGTETVRAVAVQAGWVSSPVGVASYSISDYAVPWNSTAVFGTATDVRDGQTYRTATIGSLTWMAQNLNYRGTTGSSDTVGICYGNSLDSCAKYGRLYIWTEAMAGASSSASSPSGAQGVCPSGWHVPSDTEWNILQDFVDSTNTVDGRMLKSTSGWLPNGALSGDGTDVFGFRGLPGGYSNEGFSTAGSIGCWWSATSDGAGGAWYRGLYGSFDDMDRSNYDISDGFSLRCVRDP
jgi:uncharacterized protein (TIGR02145 family)